MKTEDFDDAIRRKLESINNSHVQQDVDAIHHYVLNKQAGTLKHRYATIIFSAAAAIVLIGGLFTWNMLQVKEIDTLKQTIAELNISPAAAHEKAETGPQKNNSLSPDKYTKQSQSLTGHANGSILETDHVLLNENLNKKESQGNSAMPSEKEAYAAAQITNVYKTGKSNEPVTSPERNNVPETEQVSQSSGASVVKDSDVTGKKEDQMDLKSPDDKEAARNSSIQDSSATTGIHKKPVDPVIDSALAPMETAQPVYSKNWHYGLGIGLEAGNQQQGYAILGQAVFKKRWAISAGIKLLKNGQESFGDDDDFDHHKKNKFKNTYGNYVSDGPNKDIGIKNTIVQIPLNISYILPVKKNFSLLAGIGTDLDIYTKQHVEYRHVNNTNDFQTNQFVTNYPPVYFNNVVITAGLQKTIHRFTFQLSPYFSPQVKRVEYKKENCYYGLRLRTFFEF